MTGWKFHVFSDELDDLFRVGQVLVPFLKRKGYYWKTYGNPKEHIKLMRGIQRGKAFTIYITCKDPTNIDMVRKIAWVMAGKIDKVLVSNGLTSSDAKFIGDKRVPGTRSGRVWYRYDGERIGPGPGKGYASAKKRPRYNLKENPDIF
jgi:hypothetical protein